MTKRTIVLAAMLVAVGLGSVGSVHAQEPVVGVKDPEALFTDQDPTLNRNKQAALRIMRELLQCGQWDRAGEWLTQAYHQHNPNAASGLDGVVAFFTKVHEGQAHRQVRQADDGSRRGDRRRRLRHGADAAQYPIRGSLARSTTRRGLTPGASSTARPTSTGIRRRLPRPQNNQRRPPHAAVCPEIEKG